MQQSGAGKRSLTGPCVSGRQLKRQWAEDPFLQAGGETKETRRPPLGFSHAFATLHKLEAQASAATLRQLASQSLASHSPRHARQHAL